jgi:excisionase family DNA binding protein
MENHEQRLLTAKQVAERLCVHPRQVYRLKDAGKIPAPIKLGGATRWISSVLDDWFLNGCPALRFV